MYPILLSTEFLDLKSGCLENSDLENSDLRS